MSRVDRNCKIFGYCWLTFLCVYCWKEMLIWAMVTGPILFLAWASDFKWREWMDKKETSSKRKA